MCSAMGSSGCVTRMEIEHQDERQWWIDHGTTADFDGDVLLYGKAPAPLAFGTDVAGTTFIEIAAPASTNVSSREVGEFETETFLERSG